jgi:hypothetical protein
MTNETEDLRALLRALAESRLIELPDYSADPAARSRTGAILAGKSGPRPLTRRCLENMGERSRGALLNRLRISPLSTGF